MHEEIKYFIFKSKASSRLNLNRKIVICIFFGFVWSSLPLIGWSYYTLDISSTTCSAQWNEKALKVFTYNISMFIFVYLIPLIIILVSNFKIILMVRLKLK